MNVQNTVEYVSNEDIFVKIAFNTYCIRDPGLIYSCIYISYFEIERVYYYNHGKNIIHFMNDNMFSLTQSFNCYIRLTKGQKL